MKRVFTIVLLLISVGRASAQIAVYSGSGGLSTAISGVPNETVSILQKSNFGTNTPCTSGGLSGMTVATSWTTYSPVSTAPRVFFQITPSAGYVLNITNITVGLRRSGTGPVNTRFAYSLDNGATWIDDGVNHAASAGGCGSTVVSSWGGPALPTGISSTVNGIIIAFFPFAPSAATGTYQVNSIVVDGSVTGGCSTPAVFGVTGGGSYCAGGTGVSVGLSNSETGVSYQLYRGSMSVGSPVAGTGSAVSFGPMTAAGSYTVQATSTPGCTSNMTGSAVVSINPAPSAIAGSMSVCEGTSVTLSNTVTGGTWNSGSTSIASIDAASGIVNGLVAGTSVISYTTPTCAPVTVTVTVNPLAAITGALTLCEGTSSTLVNVNAGGTWTSSSLAIASIGSSSGVVSGLSNGVSLITYGLPTGCNAYATVTVNAAVAAIAGSGSVCVGGIRTLTDASAGGTWSTSSTTIASVSTSGVLTGNAPGVAMITYTLPTGCFATTFVTVQPLPGAIAGSAFVCNGSTTTLSSSATGGTWLSSNPSVAPITTAGVVTGLALGTSAVTYTLGTGCATSVIVTVNPLPASITGPSEICEGLSVTVSSGTVGGVWQTSTPFVATVNASTGEVSGVAAGVAIISYVFGTGCSVTHVVTVNAPPAAIAGPSAVCESNIVTLTDASTGGTWTSSDPTLATISSGGMLTGVLAGTVSISYEIPGCNATTYAVTVNPLPSPITGITNVCVGSLTTLSNATPGGTWSGSNTMATVTGGVVTGMTPGSSTVVSYTLPTGCIATVPVVVDSLPALIGGLDSVCKGSSITLTDVTPGGIWTSSDGTKAYANAITGVVTGMESGSVLISYSLVTGCRRTMPFYVKEPLPAGVIVTMSPDTTTICVGTAITFTAHAVNGGAPTFEWAKFGLTQDTGSTFTYVPTHGDFISVDMTPHSICAAPNPAHASVYLNIYPTPLPSVSIMTYSDTVLHYQGQIVTFYTDVTFGGSVTEYQWYRNNVAVSGATNSSYAAELYASDTFYCVVKGNAPCGPVVSTPSNRIIISSTLGVASSTTVSDLQLYPNPNAGSFVLSGHVGGRETVVVEIVDMLGQQVYRTVALPVNGVVNLNIAPEAQLATGSYVMRVHSAGEQQQFHFVVSR